MRLGVMLGVTLLGVTLNVASFYPGYMSADSVVQLSVARSGDLYDWHPPVMTLLWRVLDHVLPGPQGMLLLHNLWFWSGLALLCHLAIQRTAIAAGIALSIGLSPPIFGLLGTVWKDVGLACSLLMAISLLALAQARLSWSALVGAVPLLFYALSVRHEGLVAVLPVCVWAGLIGAHLPCAQTFIRRRLMGIAIGFALCLALVSGNSALVRRATQGKPATHPEQVLLVYDLAYLSRLSHHWLLPAYLTEKRDEQAQLGELEHFFDEKQCAVHYCDDFYLKYPPTADPDHFRQLRSAWLGALVSYPRQYAAMKGKLFRSNYAIGTPEAPYSFHPGIDPNTLGVELHPSPLNRAVMTWLTRLQHGVFFRAWCYLAALLLFLMVLVALGANPLHPAMLVAASALLKELLHIAWWSGYDFRYHWWTAYAVFVVPLVWLATRGVAPAVEGSGVRQRILGQPSPWTANHQASNVESVVPSH